MLNKLLRLTHKAKKIHSLLIILQKYCTKNSKTIAFWREDELNQQLLHLFKIGRLLTFGRT